MQLAVAEHLLHQGENAVSNDPYREPAPAGAETLAQGDKGDTAASDSSLQLISSSRFDLSQPASSLLEQGTSTLILSYESMRHAFDVVRRLLDTVDKPLLIERINQAVRTLVSCEQVSVYLLDDDGELRWMGSKPPLPPGQEPQISRTVARHVLESREAVISAVSHLLAAFTERQRATCRAKRPAATANAAVRADG